MQTIDEHSRVDRGRWREWNIDVCRRVQGECGWRGPSSTHQRRVREIADALPAGVRTVLDAGCGNGWLTNALSGPGARFAGAIVGVDFLAEALRHVQAARVQGDLCLLPFADRSFDLVLCCEVLEHLDGGRYERVRGELARVARQYILITVPNEEDLKSRSYTCADCGVTFNPQGHLRSFSPENVRHVFDGVERGAFTCTLVRGVVNVPYRPPNGLLSRLHPTRFGYWRRSGAPWDGSRCPQCGSQGRRDTALSQVWRGGLRLAGLACPPYRRQRAKWLLGQYQRR